MTRSDGILGPVPVKPGEPLYRSAAHAIRRAIEGRHFLPGARLPSTRQLASRLGISLVTAHRATQELVRTGVLRRATGRGTIVHERFDARRDRQAVARVGLVMPPTASLVAHPYASAFDGIRWGAIARHVDVVLLRYEDDPRSECDGLLYLDPTPEQLKQIESLDCPAMVIGAKTASARLGSIEVDNIDLARQATGHLIELGHKGITLLTDQEHLPSHVDRRRGFAQTCSLRRLADGAAQVLAGCDRYALAALLNSKERPTAIFAATFNLALDVYAVARSAELEIPDQLSVIAVDDPPAAAQLAPPLTTMRQPLVRLGEMAISALLELVSEPGRTATSRTLWAELVDRGSTAPPDLEGARGP